MAEAAKAQAQVPVLESPNCNNGMKSSASDAHHHVEELPNPPTSFWTRLQSGWSEVEEHLAEWFGLNQSKYQWAVDESMERQLAGDHQVASSVEGLQMQDIQEQTMERDSKG